MLILAVAGPLSIAHASLHAPFAGNAIEAGAVSADPAVSADAEVSTLKLKDGKQAPPHVQHQHCAVCPAVSAIDVSVPQVPVWPDPMAVTYSIHSIDDTAKFAPPPLRKPPRI